MREGLTLLDAGRAQRWMRCWLLIRWIAGDGAGRAGVRDGCETGCAWSMWRRITG